MPLAIGWDEVALRLALAVFAGALLGVNRSERGMTAGLRTTLLVTLAAAVSMIQVNLLLGTADRPAGSIVMLDLMRLPLGVLTGMGFIGAGAILRRGDRVSGVTTAATLWLATVLGLCFGGGQHGLGLAGLGLGAVTLWALKRWESRLPQERRGSLALSVGADGPDDEDIRRAVEAGGGTVSMWDVTYSRESGVRKVRCEVHWPWHAADPSTPAFVRGLVRRDGVHRVRWRS